MKLSLTELKVLEQLAHGNKTVKAIAAALKKSDKQIYRTRRKLAAKRFITPSEKVLELTKSVHVALLLPLLSVFPSLTKPLSESGIKIFTSLLDPKNITKIVQETGFKKGIIYQKLRQAKQISLVLKHNKDYVINEQIWLKVSHFLQELKKYEEATDERIPANSVIYFKSDREIVFSTPEAVDACLTGFSAYEQYDLRILSPIPDYYLPKKKLTIGEVFRHSLWIVGKEQDIRNLIYVALFYIKFKSKISKIKHTIIDNIKAILSGKVISGYPTLLEIKEKAEIYDLRI